MKIDRHVVLFTPEVHWNTGNIGRTCLGVGATLHLIKPLGFSLTSKAVKRAGLDYWQRVDLKVWENWQAFSASQNPLPGEVALLSKGGSRPFWEIAPVKRQFLIFGSETAGLPAFVCSRYPQSIYHIPISREIRCLNLSTAVGIVLYESLRASGMVHEWRPTGDGAGG
jgi:tRNA (cytidine/uridine-2'-O-)-methyltransferase